MGRPFSVVLLKSVDPVRNVNFDSRVLALEASTIPESDRWSKP